MVEIKRSFGYGDSYFHPTTGEILPGQHPPAYQVFVRKAGAAAVQLNNSFNIAVFPVNPPPGNPVVTVNQAVQTIGGEQYYLYREGIIQVVNPRMLAVWQAAHRNAYRAAAGPLHRRRGGPFMACCGKQRNQLAGPDGSGGRPPERCFFRYIGRTALTVAGPVSGQYYRFLAPGATVEVAPAVEQVPQLRRV